MREASDMMQKCGVGSPPSGAHGGGWEALGAGWRGTSAAIDYNFIINCHRNKNSYLQAAILEILE